MKKAEKIAEDMISKRRTKLDALIDEIAIEKNLSLVEKLKFASIAREAVNRGEIRL